MSHPKSQSKVVAFIFCLGNGYVALNIILGILEAVREAAIVPQADLNASAKRY